MYTSVYMSVYMCVCIYLFFRFIRLLEVLICVILYISPTHTQMKSFCSYSDTTLNYTSFTVMSLAAASYILHSCYRGLCCCSIVAVSGGYLEGYIMKL